MGLEDFFVLFDKVLQFWTSNMAFKVSKHILLCLPKVVGNVVICDRVKSIRKIVPQSRKGVVGVRSGVLFYLSPAMFNGVKFTMELWQHYTSMATFIQEMLQFCLLVSKIRMCGYLFPHVLKLHLLVIFPPFLQHLDQPFGNPNIKHHPLDFSIPNSIL